MIVPLKGDGPRACEINTMTKANFLAPGGDAWWRWRIKLNEAR